MDNETIFRLAKPKKKGLLPILFSRFLLIALLLVVQVALLVGIYGWLTEYVTYFSGVMAVFTLLMIIYLFNCEMDATAKLTWMFMIALFPLPTACFLSFTQTDAGHVRLKKRVEELVDSTKGAIVQSEDVIRQVKEDGSGVAALAEYLGRCGCFPLFHHTDVTYFPLGEEKFAAMLKELQKAEKYIFMEYFIIKEGYMWGRILEVLIEKAKAGVDVRVMYDGMCEVSLLPADYPKLLFEHGIKAKAFSPIMPVVSSHYNYRDHRKILVIDGKAGETVYMDILNRANEYVHIMTPYLILDGELAGALKYAAQRGVDVKMILPGIPDNKAAHALAKSHYQQLVNAGVKIYEYTPGFVHAKVFVSDDIKAVVGTINLDYRSLYHHFECGTFLYRTECIAEIEKDFQDTLEKCSRVTQESIKNEKISYKMMGSCMKFIAPLM